MNVRRLKAADDVRLHAVTSATDELTHAEGLLARCSSGGPWEPVLAGRLGQLHARHGSGLHALLACIDRTLVDAGRGPATPHVACSALEAWTSERARLGCSVDDALTGLPGADGLQRHLDESAAGTVRRVLVAEVMIDGPRQRGRGALGELEAELSLALVRAVLDDGLAAQAPWARLGRYRLGTVVDPSGPRELAAAVGRARRWLARWRSDVDVSAWMEPVPLDPGARGALVRDLAM